MPSSFSSPLPRPLQRHTVPLPGATHTLPLLAFVPTALQFWLQVQLGRERYAAASPEAPTSGPRQRSLEASLPPPDATPRSAARGRNLLAVRCRQVVVQQRGMSPTWRPRVPLCIGDGHDGEASSFPGTRPTPSTWRAGAYVRGRLPRGGRSTQMSFTPAASALMAEANVAKSSFPLAHSPSPTPPTTLLLASFSPPTAPPPPSRGPGTPASRRASTRPPQRRRTRP